ncbi:hypothetical protein GCM10009038_10080 [Salinicola rhizosphaerae]|uniref:Uncharacterized protein n=1 Tax=Salinicola rhizosphaerae TaxID=1443141 RepID=A0ABQ3DUJ3_9GAMM|nr:hypothetical protein GCM10009038_10080 [Salinicola rhizosphaerae]
MVRIYDLASERFWDMDEEDPRRALVFKALQHYGGIDTIESRNQVNRAIVRGQHGLSYRDLCVSVTSIHDRKH